MQARRAQAMGPRFGSRLRIALARRPWIRWLIIGGLAVAAGATVADRMRDVDEARAAWTDRVTVFVARHDHVAGDRLVVDEAEVPRVAAPDSAIVRPSPDAIARQRISAGEVVVEVDLVDVVGPAAGAEIGHVVVPVRDPLVTSAPIGGRVAIFAEGIVLAASAEVVESDGDVIFIAVETGDGPLVAAAARTQEASIVFLP